MDIKGEVIKLLNETYDLKDLDKLDIKSIQKLRKSINKYIGLMSLRSKKVNIIEERIRKLIRVE